MQSLESRGRRRSSSGSRWGTALLVVAAVVLGCGAVEIAGRIWLEPVHRAPLPTWPHGLVIPDGIRGYRYAADFAGAIERDGRTISIRTNALGLRERALSPADQSGQLLALGDSFTVGFGVEQHEAWPARLEAALAAPPTSADPPRVINGGISGYSLKQIRLTAEELIPRLRPRLVIVGAYGSRYWRIENPYAYFHGYAVSTRMLPRLRVDAAGTLLLSSAKPRWRPAEQWLDDHTFVGSRLFRALPARLRGSEAPVSNPPPTTMAAFFREIDALNELAQRHGAVLVVVLVSHQYEAGDFSGQRKPYNDNVREYCRRRGIPVFDTIPAFEREEAGRAPVFRLPSDHHWSARAHAVVGNALAAFLTESGLAGRLRAPAEFPGRSHESGVLERRRAP